MKTVLILMSLILISSCTGNTQENKSYREEILYLTEKSESPSGAILNNMENKTILLSLPSMVKESYDYVYYLLPQLYDRGITRVVLPLFLSSELTKEDFTPDNRLKTVMKNYPEGAQEEFLALFDYIEKVNTYREEDTLTLTTDLTQLSDGLPSLVLTFHEIRYKTARDLYSLINSETVITAVLYGPALKDNEWTYPYRGELNNLIDRLPSAKKSISFLTDDFPGTFLSDWDIYIIMGPLSDYTVTTPLKNLYNEENYTELPQDYLDQHSSLINYFTLKNLNDALPDRAHELKTLLSSY